MNDSIELFSQLFALSFGFWMLYGFYTTLRLRFFIVKRYEQDTDLNQTRYFREMLPWVTHIPPFFRSSIYVSHLLKFLWYEKNDRFASKKKKGKGQIAFYDDIKSPEQVTSHFSKKEIKRVKRLVFVLLCVLIHLTFLIVFSFIWPDEFGFL